MAENKKRSVTNKILRQRGLRRRWLNTSVLPVLLVVVMLAFLASTGMSNYYYNSMLDGLRQQAQAQAGAFNDYFMNNGYADYYQKAVQTTAEFQDKDRIELQFISSSGRIQVSTSGLTAGSSPDTPDIAAAIANNQMEHFRGRDPATNEAVMAVCINGNYDYVLNTDERAYVAINPLSGEDITKLVKKELGIADVEEVEPLN